MLNEGNQILHIFVSGSGYTSQSSTTLVTVWASLGSGFIIVCFTDPAPVADPSLYKQNNMIFMLYCEISVISTYLLM
jgi:hypothetical protein